VGATPGACRIDGPPGAHVSGAGEVGLMTNEQDAGSDREIKISAPIKIVYYKILFTVLLVLFLVLCMIQSFHGNDHSAIARSNF
jgi:hypothetical protein